MRMCSRRQELVNANTATAMLQAVRRFFNEMLASKGHRTDVERNAFWAGVVGLMPADLIENRQGRAMMRILELQEKLEARGYVWCGQMADSTPKRLILGTLFVHRTRARKSKKSEHCEYG